jgi:hypothetical protein
VNAPSLFQNARIASPLSADGAGQSTTNVKRALDAAPFALAAALMPAIPA